ncbi:hypothetical protein H632_c360p0 [Helicosporidium sp. ATCC 50920]|nr:hypothetical protein H632_c360p0 [Helicosporidium sp. ATCC 50920]|eukprot:KDD76090.1 hypothetical protein H632_c360p0 [Helicosporidium sp. ATCC 50920]
MDPAEDEPAGRVEASIMNADDDMEAALEEAFDAVVENDEAVTQAQAEPSSLVPEGLGNIPLTAEGCVDLDQLSTEQRQKLNTQVVKMLSEKELDRYEAFRRSSLKKPMQQIMHVVTGMYPKPQDKALVALASVAKSLVGELVETARTIASRRGQSGPLEPEHIHAAYRRLCQQGLVETVRTGKRRRFL